MSSVLPRVTPRRALPDAVPALRLTDTERATAHMLASLLLDYPDASWFTRLTELRPHVATLPTALASQFAEFITAAETAGEAEWQRQYVLTFDLKRKCSLYLSYYATGDTRRRGVALVTFLEAYRAAGWEFDADDLPDYLPAVLEFSARSDSEVSSALIASHREGIEVLRAALESMQSPWSHLVRAITMSLPPIDDRTRDRFLELINEGPPTETVGLSFLGNLPPFRPISQEAS